MLALRYVLWWLDRCVLALRYGLRVHGLEQVKDVQGPVLVLPNHPAYIDPPLALAALWPTLKPRPLVFQTMYRHWFLWPFMKLLNALEVADLDQQASARRGKPHRAPWRA